MNNREIDAAIAAVRQGQDVVLIQLGTYLRSRSRESAARLDCAIEAQTETIDRVAGCRSEYLAKGVNQ